VKDCEYLPGETNYLRGFEFSSTGSIHSALTFEAIGGIARGIFDVASRLVRATFCLVGFAFHFLVAGELASALFYGALGFVCGSLHVLAIHSEPPPQLRDLSNVLVGPFPGSYQPPWKCR
jgi:hypothetical protein